MTRFAVLGRAALPSQYHSATAPVLVSAQAGQLLELHAGRGSAVHVFALSGTGVQLQGTRQTDSPSVLARIQSDTFILEGAALDRLVSVGDQGPLGISRSEVFYSGQSGFAGDLASVLSAPVGGRDLLVAAGAGLPGLQSFERLADGSLRALQWRSDTGSSYARDVSAMASLELGGTRYVFTAAQSESGISSYALTAGGQLNLRASLGAAEGVGLNLPTALHATEVGGQAMLLVGAAGSGSLSVMAVAADGRLSLRDHLSDTLETRFAGVQVLDSITHAGWTYVVAGGSDDGLTLFALLPGGRLIPLDSIADTAALGLDNVNGLALSVVGNRLNVLATSETEPGVTHLGIDIARSGAILAGGDSQLSGGSGDDIVIGGAAQGRLSGGGGRDIFVLQADSNPDCTVMDFDLEEDRIDLKAWEGLRSVAQVQITTRSDGAQLSFGGHELRLITSDGSSLTYEDFLRSDLLGLYRPPLPAQTPRQITGGDGDEQLLGAAGPDQLRGMGGADTLFGQDGEDSLWGGSGGDLLYGGGDRDHLYGEDDDDQLFGEDGPDQIYGGAGPDSLYGGLGDDLLDGEAGADRIWGDAGNDSLFGNSSTDQLHGGAGDDSLVGGTGDDTLYGGDGNDTLYGNTALDTIYGEAGDDYISSGDGVDYVEGGSGNDTIHGRSGWDSLYGGDDNDVLYGSSGDDLLSGGNGDDWLSAGSAWDRLFGDGGNDTLYGNFGSDWMSGGAGEDSLYGGTGDDTLYGDAGNDQLLGNQGVDVLEGGAGDDILRGGTLRDTFIFNRGHDNDLIEDFAPWQDRLLLSANLVGQTQSAEVVLADFAVVTSEGVRFDFGEGDALLLQGVEDLLALQSAIDFF